MTSPIESAVNPLSPIESASIALRAVAGGILRVIVGSLGVVVVGIMGLFAVAFSRMPLVILAGVLTVLVLGLTVGPRVGHCTFGANDDDAKLTTRKLDEAYPRRQDISSNEGERR